MKLGRIIDFPGCELYGMRIFINELKSVPNESAILNKFATIIKTQNNIDDQWIQIELDEYILYGLQKASINKLYLNYHHWIDRSIILLDDNDKPVYDLPKLLAK